MFTVCSPAVSSNPGAPRFQQMRHLSQWNAWPLKPISSLAGGEAPMGERVPWMHSSALPPGATLYYSEGLHKYDSLIFNSTKRI